MHSAAHSTHQFITRVKDTGEWMNGKRICTFYFCVFQIMPLILRGRHRKRMGQFRTTWQNLTSFDRYGLTEKRVILDAFM
jgi:hypothetical protein